MNMILEGKTLCAQIRKTLAQRAQSCQEKLGRPLKLVGIGWQGGYASYLYLQKEMEAAQKFLIQTELIEIAQTTSQKDLLEILNNLRNDETADAVLIPKPLPKHLDTPQTWQSIPADKDIDGSSALNTGRLFLCKSSKEIADMQGFAPCTAKAVMALLKYHKIPLNGVEAAVIGRSSTVGKPAAHMLTCENATVKILHSKTKDIQASLCGCDIIVCAIGSPRFLKADMIKEGAVVVDVGTNEDENGVYCGDVDYDEVSKKARALSPVPGGVGPLTLTFLLENIIISAERKL
ncbi:MAG: bifunctional 5,10-methylenetetrahydrofolate dehydrogenase/5,10-methenyltetrahydrofolate cyclohydrolase [Elusimicrobiota bacterium]|nr:bifunctional 5,10-methylenetetrahydrofolate dehydrogenase/5,10-methenyltetrahydrofolate cyclohydrolase [Elusimicrobiota bacterium]